MSSVLLETVSSDELLGLVTSQRWFGAKSREAVDATVVGSAPLGVDLLDLLVEIRFGTGAQEIYQLVVTSDGDRIVDATGVPELAGTLLELVRERATAEGESGSIEFCASGEAIPATPVASSVSGVEQSNSSLIGGEVFVKVYRRIEAGSNPELEMLRFLASHGFEATPELFGWWSYSGTALAATLGIAQRFADGASDGWSLALDALRSEPAGFLDLLGDLGRTIGTMHATLASDPEDPAFAPEDALPESLALMTASMDDEIEDVFTHLPDVDAVTPIVGCGDAIRELLAGLSTSGSSGKLIRNHGDVHLGQVLRGGDRWLVIDFEGEPARSLAERRAKRPALRDVAGMLRSFAYAVSVAGRTGDGTEDRARKLFLEGYFDALAGSSVLPAGPQVERLLAIFELEKAVYELRYELAHRPDWVRIPVAAIERLLGRTDA